MVNDSSYDYYHRLSLSDGMEFKRLKGFVSSVVSDERTAGSDDRPNDSDALPDRSDYRIPVLE